MGGVTTPEPSVNQQRLERQAVIDLGALADNISRIRQQVAPAEVMMVVKANAYGHGMIPVAQAAADAGADWLGTAHIHEALQLRAVGIPLPILSWLHTPYSDFDAAIAQGIDLGVSSQWELDAIVHAVMRQQGQTVQQGQTARIHLKIDTGLGRNGSTAEAWETLVTAAAKAQNSGFVDIVAIWTHFAVADEQHRPETDQQLARYHEALAVAASLGVTPRLKHAANSPAIFTRPDSHLDLVRAGVCSYGLSPLADRSSKDLGLRPVMALKTVVAQLKKVPAGQGVSYGLNYCTEQASTLALIPLGYGDGVPRHSDGGTVRIAGETYPVVGRVAMDQIVVDLGTVTPPPGVEVGAEVVLFDAELPVEHWAQAAETINYEIVTRISDRVPRVYLKNGENTGREPS